MSIADANPDGAPILAHDIPLPDTAFRCSLTAIILAANQKLAFYLQTAHLRHRDNDINHVDDRQCHQTAENPLHDVLSLFFFLSGMARTLQFSFLTHNLIII